MKLACIYIAMPFMLAAIHFINVVEGFGMLAEEEEDTA